MKISDFQIERETENTIFGMDELQTVYGIGPVMARKLIKQLIALGYERDRFKLKHAHVYTRSEIYKMLKHRDIWDSLPEAARAYLLYLPDRKIPRAVIEILDNELHRLVNGLRLTIAGSYRRGRPTSNDADIVVLQRQDLLERIQTGISKSRTVEILPPYAIGPDKISIMFRIHIDRSSIKVRKSTYVVKSDIFITNAHEYKFMLLFATGSGGFNIMMRAQAKRRGMLLNQHGLYDRDGTAIPLKNEHEIFERIGVTYKIPEERELKIHLRNT